MAVLRILCCFNWKATLSLLNTNYAAYALIDTLRCYVVNFVPQVEFKKTNFPVWFSKELKNLNVR